MDVRTEPVDERRTTRWGLVLYFAWASLAAWLVFAFARGETLRDDGVALPGIAFCVVSAVIGSRIFLWVQDHFRERSHHRAIADKDALAST